MKKTLLLLLFIPFLSFSQKQLEIENGEIIWQKVYETNLTKEEIKSSIKANPILNPILDNLSGTANPVKMECEETIPIYLEGKIQFFVLIQLKENRYRVTISNINIIPHQTVGIWGVNSSENPQNIEDYQIRNNGEFRKNRMARNTRYCIEDYLTELFKINNISNDW